MDENLVQRYARVTRAIARLAQYPRYESAFVFGSSATGQVHAGSDIDVMVVLAEDTEHCANINHPWLDGIPLDISFNTWADVEQKHAALLQQQPRRRPWICTARILFDKTGRLRQFQQQMQTARPSLRPLSERASILFDLHERYTQPGKYLASAPETANLIMHMELGAVLRLHYSLHGRWWVSNKHIPANLQEWDAPGAQLLNAFLQAGPVAEKVADWQALIEHVLAPLGGKDFGPLEQDCPCPTCQADLARLRECGG